MAPKLTQIQRIRRDSSQVDAKIYNWHPKKEHHDTLLNRKKKKNYVTKSVGRNILKRETMVKLNRIQIPQASDVKYLCNILSRRLMWKKTYLLNVKL